MMYLGISNMPVARSHVNFPYAWWDNLFTPEEFKLLCSYFEKHGTEAATLGPKNKVDTKVRSSKIKMHLLNDENRWIFEKFNFVIQQINSNFYGFDLNGYEAIQYGEYHAKDNGKYDWHLDMQFGDRPLETIPETRKLSITFLLNEAGVDFEGGEFEIATDFTNLTNVNPKKGQVVAFPSFLNHRVKPVTKGVRKSLVIWVLGPKFK